MFMVAGWYNKCNIKVKLLSVHYCQPFTIYMNDVIISCNVSFGITIATVMRCVCVFVCVRVCVCVCRQSVQCKVQVSMLECVGQICAALSLPSLSMEDGTVAMAAYLHGNQPEVLQEVAMGVARQLIGVNSDIVWLVLCQMCPLALPQTTPPPGLTPFTFRSHSESEKYVKNIQKLLPLTLLS